MGSKSESELFYFPGKKKRSKVWAYFGFQKKGDGPANKDNLNLTKVTCKLCKKEYTFNGNTTILNFYLDNEHKNLQLTTPVANQSKPQKQPTLFQWVPGYETTVTTLRRLSRQKKTEIDNKLVSLIIESLLLFSTVEQNAFISFVKEIDTRYDPPGRKLLMTLVHKLYQDVRGRLEADLQHVPYVAITHDAWSSINTQSYDTMTVHYISNDWELKSSVLRTELFPGSHTGENIADNFMQTVETWKLPELIAVTDNAANERKAFEILGWNRLGCYGHRINLVVKAGMSVPEVAKQVAKGRSVVTYFHQSPLATGVLLQKQQLLLSKEAQGHKLIQDVAIRWNSTLDMLQRLSEQTLALHEAVHDSTLGKKGVELRSKLNTYDEQVLVDAVVVVLEPFKVAIQELLAETTPTQHLVLPILKKLEIALTENENDKSAICKLKREMRSQMECRTLDVDIGFLACLLSPSTKQLMFVNNDEHQKAKSLLWNEISMKHMVIAVKQETELDVVQVPDQEPPLPDVPELSLTDIPNSNKEPPPKSENPD